MSLRLTLALAITTLLAVGCGPDPSQIAGTGGSTADPAGRDPNTTEVTPDDPADEPTGGKPGENTEPATAGDDPAGDDPANDPGDEPTTGASDPKDPADPKGDDPKDPADPPSDDPRDPADDPARRAAADGRPTDPDYPYPLAIDLPDLPKDAEWINSGPLTMKDLKGKYVLFDFWTYCCINCIHILPELKKLEHEYPNELVVIGVHAAKFDTEKDPKNISEAVLRYEIEHPVLVDSDHRFWQTLGVSSWPTVILIAPDGKGVWGKPGEIRFEEVNAHIKAGLPYFREKKILDETPIRFDLLADHEKDTPLRFPGKIMADEKGDRLFITDSNHNRIVVTAPDGKLLDIIGSGKIGRADGDFKTASFDHPQGLALTGDTLYVADTENHMIRKVDLKERQVTTISGTGSQGGAWPGIAGLGPLDDLPEKFVGKPKETALNSPWALWVHGKDLYIAMAGPHQIWKMPLDESEVGPFAGNGREDIVDGPLMPSQPYAQDASSFAQPSGLSSDGEYLFVADSEGSSIRAVPFDPKQVVKTVVGTAKLPYGRLFEFGDVDGPREQAKLQHALEVVYHEGTIYVADTYNNKVKAIDAETGETKTLAGTGKPGKSDDDGTFDEPAGLALLGGKLYVADTNNHLIRTIDLKTKRVGTFTVSGLKPTVKPPATKPDFALADEVELKPTTAKLVDGKVKFQVSLGLPEGWKMNPTAPLRYWTESSAEAVSSAAGGQTVTAPASQFAIELAAKAGESTVTVSVPFYYCQEAGGGLCKMGAVVFKIPLTVGAEGAEVVELKHAIE